ncbi:MAG TPA: dehydrogenase [Planctomycetaceae bacterium]|nr:dehydrogenase [Planctomycetaceae bacterium]
MARVSNWQLGRPMAYWYPEARPRRQFAAVFDINKCIACQTCTLACKTTWTSGRGQETMLWNNVESKPYGGYPLAWDLRLLQQLDGQSWQGSTYAGRTIFEAAPGGQRTVGWRPAEQDYAYPNVGEDDCAGLVEHGARMELPHPVWFFYLARICNHCTYPACLASCPRGAIYKRPEDGIVLVDQSRCRGYQECVRGCPYKKVFFNPITHTSEKCIGGFPKIEEGLQPQCFVNCIGKIRLTGWISQPDKAQPDNPVDWLVHIKGIALPLFPQFGLEPNVYYIPPVHVPLPFLRQVFGPRVDDALAAYRQAPDDPDLAGLLALFGSTPKVVPRWKRQGDSILTLDDRGKEIVGVPMREPVYIREAFDAKYQVARTNCP